MGERDGGGVEMARVGAVLPRLLAGGDLPGEGLQILQGELQMGQFLQVHPHGYMVVRSHLLPYSPHRQPTHGFQWTTTSETPHLREKENNRVLWILSLCCPSQGSKLLLF